MLVLYGNLGVLGLLILQKHTRRPKSTDYSIFRFIQAVVRFLWDAHNCEEARSIILVSYWSILLILVFHWSGRKRNWWCPLPISSTGTI